MVLEHLHRRCAENGVRLLFAAERGSRCFGTQDAASDHDVVAVVASPLADYLSLDAVPEAYGTETEGEVSSTLIDIRRAMRSSTMSRISFHSLARSLDVVFDPVGLGEEMRRLSALSLVPGCSILQYQHQVDRAVRAMRVKEKSGPKAWLHLLQPLMGLLYVDFEGKGPPMDFDALAAACRERDLAVFARGMKEAKLSGAPATVGEGDVAMVMAYVEAARAVTRERGESGRPRLPHLVARANAVILATVSGESLSA